MKLLTVDRQGDVLQVPMDPGSIRRYHLNAEEVFELEQGKAVIRGSTSFTLEEPEEE